MKLPAPIKEKPATQYKQSEALSFHKRTYGVEGEGLKVVRDIAIGTERASWATTE